MKWDKSARMLAVAGLTLASAGAWAQVIIQNGATTTVGGVTTTAAPVNTLGIAPVAAPAAVNNGAGINPSSTTTGGVTTLNPLSAFGGNGGPGANPSATTVTGNASYKFGTGLNGSAHDFASGTGDTKIATAGLCTFCHTPHKAKSTLLLWNHTLSANTFQWDVAATTSGTALPGFAGGAYNGPSAKCLSCHDGSVAIGDVGWFNEATPTGANALAKFFIGTTTTPGTGATGNSRQVGANGNLSGNHPVAVPYPLGLVANVYNGSTTGAQLATNDWVTDPTVNNIRLYSDIGGGAIVGKTTPGKTGIECSSCHDPHNKASKGDYFLRGTLSGADQASGYICLQCHSK